MSVQSKLEQATAIEFKIKGINQQIELSKKVSELAVNETGQHPRIGIKVNPQMSSNVLWLEPGYLPFDNQKVIDSYLKNMGDHKRSLETELSDLFK